MTYYPDPFDPDDWRHMSRAVIVILAFVLLVFAAASIAPSTAQGHALQAWECRSLAYERAPNGERYAWLRRCVAYRRAHADAHRRAAVAKRCASMSPRATRAKCVELGRSAMPLSWTVDPAYHRLIRAESGWNPRAVNPSSGACGLHQFLPCRAFGSLRVQGDAGYRYIRARYGSPAAAWAHHRRNGWY